MLEVEWPSQSTLRYHGRISDLASEVKRSIEEAKTTMFVMPSLGVAERIVEILAEYEAVSGRSVGRINWYLGYAAWRLATVFEGVRGRSAHGAYGDPDAAELSRLGLVVDSLVGHATGLLDEDSRADRDQMG